MMEDISSVDYVADRWTGVSHDPDSSPLRQWLAQQADGSDGEIYDTSYVQPYDDGLIIFSDNLDAWISDKGQSKSFESGPQFGTEGTPPEDGGVTTLPPVDSIGRRLMSEAEIQQILDDYNRTNTALPTGSGGGSGTAPAVSLPDLSRLACADLAHLENEREDKIQSGRSFAITGLNLTGDYFRGEEAYQAIYDAFERLDNAGQFDHGNAASNVWAVFLEARDPNSLLGISLRSIGLGIAAEFAILTAVQGVFLAQKELDLINEEQGRRNGRCG